jgi:hypothetical protein
MKRFTPLFLFLIFFLLAPILYSQSSGLTDTDKKIIADTANSQLMKNLEYLCDVIGPRVTGSDALKRANEWTAERFKEYGLENVHLENWKFGVQWTRGESTARLLEPRVSPLTVAQMAWTPGTNGPVTGPVVLVDIKKAEDTVKYVGKLKNAFVLLGPPSDLPAVPRVSPLRLPDTVAPPRQRPPMDSAMVQRFRRGGGLRDTINRILRDEGIACIIRDADKDQGLLNMTGSPANVAGMGFQRPGAPPPAPPMTTVFMTHEHYALLYRLLQRGENVRMEMNLRCSFGAEPVDAYNTVADIRGTEKPDEMVMIGGHLDSWDLAPGATDDGTGTMAILEVARTLKAIGATPKRTIRFVMFSGEEEGLLGSRAYVQSHLADTTKISACFVMDIGSGKLRGIALQGRENVKPIMDSILAPFKSMGVIDVNLRNQGGTDHLSFDRVGIPGFSFIQDPLEYGKTHHSQTDTFDHVSKDDVYEATIVMASTVLKVANLPDMLPRMAARPQRGFGF